MARGNWSIYNSKTHCRICGRVIKSTDNKGYIESVNPCHIECVKDGRLVTPYFMPGWVNAGLLSAFGKTHRLHEDDLWPIWDEKLDLWLCNILGICTNEPEYKIGAFTVKFDWRIQKWTVK